MADALRDYVSQQVTLESQRKSSMETKSFSILTASLALVTLYIALSNQPQLGEDLKKAGPRTFLLVALIGAVVAISAALWAARPIGYPAVSIADLNDIRERLVATMAKDDPDPAPIADELLEAQLRDLKDARTINTSRAHAVFASLLFLGIETAGLIVSLAWAVGS
jgi:hypothetical protein